MQSHQSQTSPEQTRLLPFSNSLLEKQLQRHFNDDSLSLTSLQSYEIIHQRSSAHTLFGLNVTIQSQKVDPKIIRLIVKQAIRQRRPGSTRIGWREQSLYANLMDFMPLKTPPLVAADSRGTWLVLEINPNGRLVDRWTPADFLLSIDLLASMHELFWGLNEDLQNFSFLGRPLEYEYPFILNTAQRSLQRLSSAADSVLAQDKALLNTLNLLVKNADQLIAPLRSLPATLIHGDYWPGNLIVYPESTIFALDWQNSAIGPGILDLVTFVQESLWWFNPLPCPAPTLIARYRKHLQDQRGLSWSDSDWILLWDHALLWTFLVDWLEPLSNASNSTLSPHYKDLQRVWLTPVQDICSLRLG